MEGLLTSGFSGGALISSSFNLKDQEITIEHDPQQLSTDTLKDFFADVGYEVTVISMGMSASLPTSTNLTHDVTPGVVTMQSLPDDEEEAEQSPDYSNTNIMTSVLKTVSPYEEKDMIKIESLLKLVGGEAIVSVKFNLPEKEITVEHDPNQYTTQAVGELIAKAGFGVLIISKGMTASIPLSDIVPAEQTSPTKATSGHNDVIVQGNADGPHDHSHDHTSDGHCHDHGHDGKLRNLPEIRRMFESAPDTVIDPWVKTNAIATFTELAKAEAHTHGASSMDAVHFHEVGAVDSIV